MSECRYFLQGVEQRVVVENARGQNCNVVLSKCSGCKLIKRIYVGHGRTKFLVHGLILGIEKEYLHVCELGIEGKQIWGQSTKSTSHNCTEGDDDH